MKEITVEDILEITKGTLVIGDKKIVCENFSKDTRTIQESDVYVGIKGEKFNGNLLYVQALEKGAKVCILQEIEIQEEIKQKYTDRVIILVEDTIKAIGQIAEYKRSLYNIPVVAVTGSVGKTSTKDIIAEVVAQKYKVLKTQGNLNNHIGLPFTILGLKEEEALVIEMGMNHFGEIQYLTNIAKPSIAVITNIGTSHIGNLGSRENILKAKLEILEGLSKDGHVIINNDNDLLHEWNKVQEQYKVITYGIDEKADVRPDNYEIGEIDSKYEITIENVRYQVEVPISGKHFIYNSLSAIAVGRALKIPMNNIIEGIKNFKLTKNRMDVQKIQQEITIINDSYNASYDSMKASLEYLAEIKGGRKIAVLGDMLELGEFSIQLHKRVGEEVVKNNIDYLITIGELAEEIAKAAKEKTSNIKGIYEFKQKEEAIIFLKEFMQQGDRILLKASNALNFTQILEELKK